MVTAFLLSEKLSKYTNSSLLKIKWILSSEVYLLIVEHFCTIPSKPFAILWPFSFNPLDKAEFQLLQT